VGFSRVAAPGGTHRAVQCSQPTHRLRRASSPRGAAECHGQSCAASASNWIAVHARSVRLKCDIASGARHVCNAPMASEGVGGGRLQVGQIGQAICPLIGRRRRGGHSDFPVRRYFVWVETSPPWQAQIEFPGRQMGPRDRLADHAKQGAVTRRAVRSKSPWEPADLNRQTAHRRVPLPSISDEMDDPRVF